MSSVIINHWKASRRNSIDTPYGKRSSSLFGNGDLIDQCVDPTTELLVLIGEMRLRPVIDPFTEPDHALLTSLGLELRCQCCNLFSTLSSTRVYGRRRRC
jgi:hypothetical protein